MDTRTPQERAYDMERNGTLYFTKPTALPLAAAVEPDPQPCATLADGTVIYGDFDGTPQRGYHRSPCVHISSDQWFFSADGETISGSSQERDPDFRFEGVTLERMLSLRDFLNSGALEHMQDAVQRWAAGA